MAVVASAPPPPSTGITVEEVENVSIPLVATEVLHVLPVGTKQYKISTRNSGIVKLAFTALTSGTTFWSIYAGQPFETEGIDSGATITLYMQSTVAGQVVEIWSGR